MPDQEQLELLKQGVEVWNRWRSENPQVEIDLSGSTIEFIDLNEVNLSEANLSYVYFCYINLIKADLRGANLRGATFNVSGYSSPVNLSGANLSGANLAEVKFQDTNLSEANFCEANLAKANFHSANCYRANFTKAIFTEAILWNSSPEEDSALTWEEGDYIEPSVVDYVYEKLRMNKFHEANFAQVDFSYVDLRYVDFDGSNLSYTNFFRANLHEANFSRANLERANLRETEPNWKTLIKASLVGIDISGLDLSGQDLSNVNLKEANLSGVNFSKALALGTNFEGAVFTGACLEDWRINPLTNFNGVICEYIYFKQGRQDRRPYNGSFKPGEFTALLQVVMETVELIFTDGISWNAFFQSFQELRSQYGDLSIQAIEKKSGGAFIIRLEVPTKVDKAVIERQVKELYEIKFQHQRQCYESELKSKNGQIFLYQEQSEANNKTITSLTEIVKIMAEKENHPTNQTTIHTQTIGVIHTGSGDIANFTQNLTQNLDDIIKLINALRETAQTFPEEQRPEVQGHLDDLEDDLRQPPSDRSLRRIKATLATLFAIGCMIAGAADFSNNVLEISNKLGVPIVQAQPTQQLPSSLPKP